MTFLPGIPLPGDKPSQSQGQLRNNFTALNTVFAEDHLAFNAVNAGEHKKITFNSVIADPGLADPKCSLYIKTIAGDSELFFENFDVGGATNVVRQVSNITRTTVGSLNAIRNVSGVINTWGEVVFVAGNSTSAVIDFPIPYAEVSLTVTPLVGTSYTIAISSISGVNFRLKRSNTAGALTVKIIAVGI